MPYSNPTTLAVYETIGEYLETSSYSEKDLRDKLKFLDHDAICSISRSGSTLLQDTLTLGRALPAKCCFVMTLLIQHAMQLDTKHERDTKPNATAFLLTQNNRTGQSPYYQALLIHADPLIIQTLTEWLTFSLSLQFISKAQYASIHQNPKNLTQLVSGHYAVELDRCLGELHLACSTQRFSYQQYQQLFKSRDDLNRTLLEIALNDGDAETLRTLFLWSSIDDAELLETDVFGDTLIHTLILDRKSKQLAGALAALCSATEHGTFPPTIIERILFHPNNLDYRLLDKALYSGCYTMIEAVLHTASVAYSYRWINAVQYSHFLIKHTKYEQGFSPLNELLRFADNEGTMLYVNTILQAILNEVISLNQFRALLIHPNQCGYTPIHQAINNHSLEKTQFFFNLVKALFSQQDYDESILSRTLAGKKVMCQKIHKDAKLINAYVTHERQEASARLCQPQDKPEMRAVLTVCMPYQSSSNFNSFIMLMNQVLQFETSKLGRTTSSYKTIQASKTESSLRLAPQHLFSPTARQSISATSHTPEKFKSYGAQ